MLEKLEEKLATIKSDLEQSVANHNALIGARQIIEQLIEEQKKEITPPVE